MLFVEWIKVGVSEELNQHVIFLEPRKFSGCHVICVPEVIGENVIDNNQALMMALAHYSVWIGVI